MLLKTGANSVFDCEAEFASAASDPGLSSAGSTGLLITDQSLLLRGQFWRSAHLQESVHLVYVT